MQDLKQTFYKLLLNYSDEVAVADLLWKEIETCHSEKGRHYHDLSHLENLLAQVSEPLIKNQINHWNEVLFCLYYHDIVYNAKAKDNEEQSAELAKKRMLEMSIESINIDRVFDMILATKSHETHSNPDVNLFTDADLSILGADWDLYTKYFENVRKEYSMYPKLLYNPGRKKVLKHFLGMKRIYKTDVFRDLLEEKARINIRREIELL